MTIVFFRLDTGKADPLKPGLPPAPLVTELWRPSIRRVGPRGMDLLPAGAWWVMHHSRMFRNQGYAQLLVWDGGKLVHRSCIFPGWFRFPFMEASDLQVGDTWTAPSHRGAGLATYALKYIVAGEPGPGPVYWYVTAKTNKESIRVAEKAGFELAGEGVRTAPLGISLAGVFRITNR